MHIAVIVIVVFFCVVLIVILVVFVVLRIRRKKKGNKCAKQNGSAPKDKSQDNRSHQDSGFTENGELSEGAIIRRHVEDELNSRAYQERALAERSLGSRPDLVVAGGRATLPIRESAVILEPNGFENTGYLEEPPEHYDIDNASSIAPSDLVDVVNHYKQYRRGMLNHDKRNHHHGNHRHGITPSPSSMLASRPRESPLTVSRQSPAPFSSHRQSPNPMLYGANNRHVQPSPVTVGNGLSRKSPHHHLDRTTPLPPGSMRSTPLSGIDGLYSPVSSASSYEHPHLPASRPNSHLRQPISSLGIRATPTVGLTVDEVNRLNARHKNSSSSGDSSSEDGDKPNKINHTDFTHADLMNPAAAMPPPDSSSESDTNDDTFTCSEFEFDNDRMRQDFNNPNRLAPPKLSRVSEHEDTDNSRNGSNNPRDDSFSTFLTSDEDMPGTGSKKAPLNWDYLLNWGPNFEKLVGVFTDIAQLPDANPSLPPRGRTSPRPSSAQRPGSRPNSRPTTPRTVSPKPISNPRQSPVKPPTPRSLATPSPLHVIEEDRPYRESPHRFDNVREEYV